MHVPDLKIANGKSIPQIGLGLWQVRSEAEFDTMFAAAVQAGYTHFDTAQAYDNEQYLGKQWQTAGLMRKDIFITTKIAVEHFGYHKALASFEDSLKNLQTDYVDLLLLHFPVTLLRKKAWQALEEIQAAGGALNIGVSNYTIRHLEEMKDYASVMPSVNQVELHVFLQQPELLEYCKANNILVEAYSPIAHAEVMDDPIVQKIADKHGKTYVQIMLRWCLEKQLVVLPKSVTPARIQENMAIFDFTLDQEDMDSLEQCERDLRTCWSPVHVP